MYFGRGFALNELGDVNVIEHEGRLHLFYPCMPSHDVIAHLVSDDGVHWQPIQHSIRTGDPGECDDDQLWTMSVFRWEGRFYMLYTALQQADDGLIQRAGLAFSDDLLNWEKAAHNPVSFPDPRWYESDTSESGRADWRDPFGWVEGDTIHALICAHEKDGPMNRRGCVGHFTSRDALHWEVQPPFYSPGLSGDWEVPTVMKLGGRYYLLGHTCAPSQDIYRFADSLEGPWHRPSNDWILPRGSHIFCPVQFQGKTLLYHWIESPYDWVDRRRIVGQALASRAIAPPKEAVALPDGQLILRSCDWIWDDLSTTTGSGEVPLTSFSGKCQVEGEKLTALSEVGMGISLMEGKYADFVLEATLNIKDGCEAGLFWRGIDDANAGTFVSLIPGRQRIELQRLTVSTAAEPRRLGRGFLTLQENYCPLTIGKDVRLRIVAWGPYIEISVDNRVLLCYLTMSRRSGKIGCFVNDGSAIFSDFKLQELQTPPMPEAQLAS